MSICGNCCKDLTLPIQHLLFPDVFLSDSGKAFMSAHGFDYTKDVEFEHGGMVYKMNLLGLMRPDLYLNEEGQEFYVSHLESLVRSNAVVKVNHPCQHLTDKGKCDIYADRPQVCRDFDCSTRTDCACKQSVQPLKVHL